MAITLTKNMTILFQGDSITDCGRGQVGEGEMGYGYAYMASSWMSARYAELGLRFMNRGISGDRIEGIARRWDRDCIRLKPDVVSILAGVNNTWPRYLNDDATPDDSFYNDYYSILKKTRDTLNPQIILCEPFILYISDDIMAWRDDLDPKIEIVRKLATEFDALLVPFDTMFQEASKRANPSYWATDGVHPTPAGHALMAQEWLTCVSGL